MSREADSALQLRIFQVVFGVGLLATVTYAVRSLMWGGRMIPGLVVGGILVAAVVLFLDRRFWLFPAVLFAMYDKIPYLKFSGMELGSLVLIGAFFIRLALRQERFIKKHVTVYLSSLPFLLWVLFVWALYPTGMMILGSSSFGGRFYIDIVLAFVSFGILSTLEIDERDSKLLFWSLAFGVVLSVALKISFRKELPETEMALHYQFIHLSFLSSLLLCRYSATVILTHAMPFLLFFSTFGLSVYSGNRTAAARTVLVGILVPLFTRRNRLTTTILAAFACALLAGVVAGQGRAWNLPFAIQRSLSFLPGRWHVRLESYGFHDEFRAVLREVARDHIRASPWLGDHGFTLDAESMSWVVGTDYRRQMYAGHILARNWHNVWLGMAADFGIPLSVFWALFTAVLLWFGYRNRKVLVPRSWNESVYVYFYLMIVVEFINSFFNGGHTARTSEQWFVWAGYLIAVLNGADRAKQSVPGLEGEPK